MTARALTRRSMVTSFPTAFSSILLACARAGQPHPLGEQVGTPKPAAITFWHWGDPEYRERELRVATAFQERLKHLSVTVETIQYGDLVQKLPTSFAGGAPPDVFVMDMQWVPQYGQTTWVVDLYELIRRDKSAWLREVQAAPIAKLAFEIMSAKGMLLGLPSGAGPNLYFYNADLFRKEGLKTPYELWKEDRWTWEAFVDAAKRLTKHGSQQWDIAGAAPGLHRLWMNANGGQEFDDWHGPKRCLYDTPESIGALQLLQDLRHRDRVVPVNFNQEVGMNDTQAFVAGKVAMMARWTSGIGVYKTITSHTWGMVPYPKSKTYANDYATSGPAIARETRALEAAWEWVKFRQGADGGAIHAEDGTGVPFHPNVQKVTLRVHQAIPTLETPGLSIELLKAAKHSFVRLVSKDEAKIHNELINPELNKVWRGEEGAASAARRIAAQVNEFLKVNPQ